MSETTVNPQHFIDTQADVFRLAKARYGLSTARLSALTGIPAATLATWGKGTSMPAWAFVALAEHVPADLMNLLLEPVSLCLASVDEHDSDFDHLACEATGFTHELLEAKRDRRICNTERGRLKERARRVMSAAANVA